MTQATPVPPIKRHKGLPNDLPVYTVHKIPPQGFLTTLLF